MYMQFLQKLNILSYCLLMLMNHQFITFINLFWSIKLLLKLFTVKYRCTVYWNLYVEFNIEFFKVLYNYLPVFLAICYLNSCEIKRPCLLQENMHFFCPPPQNKNVSSWILIELLFGHAQLFNLLMHVFLWLDHTGILSFVLLKHVLMFNFVFITVCSKIDSQQNNLLVMIIFSTIDAVYLVQL